MEQTVFFPIFPQITNYPTKPKSYNRITPNHTLKPSIPKAKFLWEFILKLSIKNIIPFLVQHLILSRLSIKEKQATETEQDPVGLSYLQKPFHVPHFIFVGEKFQLPRPSLDFKGQIQTN